MQHQRLHTQTEVKVNKITGHKCSYITMNVSFSVDSSELGRVGHVTDGGGLSVTLAGLDVLFHLSFLSSGTVHAQTKLPHSDSGSAV